MKISVASKGILTTAATWLVGFSLLLPVSAGAQSRWSSFTAGLANPQGAFYENNLTLPFEKAVGAKPGIFVGYQGAGYFNESKFKFGYTYVATFASNGVNWDKWVSGSTSFSGSAYKSVELKLGLIATLSVTDDIEVDAFFRFGDNVLFDGDGTWKSSAGTTTFKADGFGLGYGTNFGINARYRKLILTAQYKTGSAKRSYPTGKVNVPITSIQVGVGIVIAR